MTDPGSREEMLELVALYALGVRRATRPRSSQRFIANDDGARDEYRALRASADALAYSADEPVDSNPFGPDERTADGARQRRVGLRQRRKSRAAASAPIPVG